MERWAMVGVMDVGRGEGWLERGMVVDAEDKGGGMVDGWSEGWSWR